MAKKKNTVKMKIRRSGNTGTTDDESFMADKGSAPVQFQFLQQYATGRFLYVNVDTEGTVISRQGTDAVLCVFSFGKPVVYFSETGGRVLLKESSKGFLGVRTGVEVFFIENSELHLLVHYSRQLGYVAGTEGAANIVESGWGLLVRGEKSAEESYTDEENRFHGSVF